MTLLEKLVSFQRQGLFCDTMLMTRDEGRVYAHSVVLAAVCPTLQALLNQQPLTNRQPSYIDLSLYDHGVVLTLIEFIYCGKLDENYEHKETLQDLLNVLGVDINQRLKIENIDHVIDESIVVQPTKKADVKRPQRSKRSCTSYSTKLLECKILKNSNQRTVVDDESIVQTNRKNARRSSILKDAVSLEHEPYNTSNVKSVALKAKCDNVKLQSSKKEEELAIKSDSFSCAECNEQFVSQFHLNRHCWKHYINESGMYECKICNKTFRLIKNFRQHIKTHEGLKEKRYKCETCGHRFSHPCRLRAHMSKHTGSMSFICDVCGHKFSRREYLTVHKRRHTGDMRYSCHVCGKKFFNWPAKIAHVRMHTKERPYQCSTCGHQFSQYNSMRQHMRLHTDERPYPCSRCSMSFRVASHLKKHILNKHVDSTDRPFACEKCARTFSTNSALKQHMQTHLDPLQRQARKKKLVSKRTAEKVTFTASNNTTISTNQIKPLNSASSAVVLLKNVPSLSQSISSMNYVSNAGIYLNSQIGDNNGKERVVTVPIRNRNVAVPVEMLHNDILDINRMDFSQIVLLPHGQRFDQILPKQI